MYKIFVVFILFFSSNSFSRQFSEDILIFPDSIFISQYSPIDSIQIINNSKQAVNLDSIYNKTISSYDCLIKLNGQEYSFSVSPYQYYNPLSIDLELISKDTALFSIVHIDVCPICKVKYDGYLTDTLIFVFAQDSSMQTFEKSLVLNSNIPLDVDDKLTPYSFYLSQNYPNPFNPVTTIEYSIPSAEFVQLKVFDILGREVSDLISEFQQKGNHQIVFNAESVRSGLPSGLYFYQLRYGNFIQIKKMILMK